MTRVSLIACAFFVLWFPDFSSSGSVPATQPAVDSKPDPAPEQADSQSEESVLSQISSGLGKAYQSLSGLELKVRVFEGVKTGVGKKPALEFDEGAREIARIRSFMAPGPKLRTEVTVRDKPVWGMVSIPDDSKICRVVQWNETTQTKPFLAEGRGQGMNWYCAEKVPGQCILGWNVLSWVGPGQEDSFPLQLWRKRIREGKYEGLKKTADGEMAHCVLFVNGDGMLFRHYVDPNQFFMLQLEKVSWIYGSGERVIGVGSQRWAFRHEIVDPNQEKFSFPTPEERKLIDVKPAQ